SSSPFLLSPFPFCQQTANEWGNRTASPGSHLPFESRRAKITATTIENQQAACHAHRSSFAPPFRENVCSRHRLGGRCWQTLAGHRFGRWRARSEPEDGHLPDSPQRISGAGATARLGATRR